MFEEGARRAGRPGGAEKKKLNGRQTIDRQAQRQVGLFVIRTRGGIAGTVVAAGGRFIAFASTAAGSRQIGTVQPSRKAAVAMIEGAAHASRLDP